MGERLRLATGVMGNAASLLLYSTPILTMSRIIRKKSTEEFSCVPYVTALLNCLLYTWYGLPVVSCGWENFPVVTINGLGILLEISFILIYFWFASPARKIKVCAILTPVIVLFLITMSISTFVFHDHHHRKVFVGCLGLVASISMYGSPLVVVKQVIATKSVEFMPFYLSFFSFLSSSLWMAYGLLSHDLFLASKLISFTRGGGISSVKPFVLSKRASCINPGGVSVSIASRDYKLRPCVLLCARNVSAVSEEEKEKERVTVLVVGGGGREGACSLLPWENVISQFSSRHFEVRLEIRD